MAEKEVKIKVSVQDQQLKDLNGTVNQTNISFGKLAGAIGIATSGYVLLEKAVSSAIGFLKDGVKAALDEENAQHKMYFALEQNNAALKRMVGFRDQMFRSTLFGKEGINAAISMGLELGRTESQTKKMVETAMGLSRVTGVDLNAAMLQLNGTYEGTIGRLGRLDGDVKKLTKSQLANGDAVELLNKKFGKLATEGMDTAEGRLIQAQKSWEEFGKYLGSKFIPILGNVADIFLGNFGEGIGKIDAQIRNVKKGIAITQSMLKEHKGMAIGGKMIQGPVVEEIYTKDLEILTRQLRALNIEKDQLLKEDKIQGIKDEIAATKELMKTNVAYTEATDRESKAEETRIKDQEKLQKEISEIMLKSRKDIIGLDEQYKLLGGTVGDFTKDKLAILESELKSLLDKGLNPTNQAIINIVNDINSIKGDTVTKMEMVVPDVEKTKQEIAMWDKLILDSFQEVGILTENEVKDIQDKLAGIVAPPQRVDDTFPTSKSDDQKYKEAFDKAQSDLKDYEDKAVSSADNIANNVISSIFDSLRSETERALQNSIDAIERMTAKSQTNLDKLNQRRFISDFEYQKRKDKLDKEKQDKETAAKKEAAKKEKTYAEEQAVVAAFLGAVMALASGSQKGPEYGLIMAAIVLAAGLADAAIIASKPLEYKQGTTKVPSYASGGFTSPFGDPTGIPAILHPSEGVVNSTGMAQPGAVQVVNALNTGQSMPSSRIHPDDISAIVSGINSKKTYVVESDITNVQNRTQVLQSRSTF